jgi:3-methyladenine DNA glycosylase AlkD
MSINPYTKSLISVFQENADPENATQMKSYLRDQFEFFGIKTPLRRKLVKDFNSHNSDLDYSETEHIIFELFAQPQRELHYTAIELSAATKKKWTEESLELFERMILTKSWWDTVDSINSLCLRPFFRRFQVDRYGLTLGWIESDSIWLQRVSLIFQLRLKENTDTDLMTRNILLLNHSDEFFIQKAIGWILRDYGHTNPEWVRRFVSSNELKPLSRREALKKIAK